jgi:PqqD family protein of HPr-rel-A system
VANPSKTQELEIRKVGDDVLVHDPAHGKVHVLNATAGAVLEMCDGARSAEEIARSLSDATGADRAVVTRDVETILSEFRTLRLLVT